ncbi:hypothetical protein N752_02250 [Desulforamulus aquiferis]|nr:hypothetical protein N752_02250 [Desulforamulus aquiferis]
MVHQELAASWLPEAIRELQTRGVEIRGCSQTLSLVPDIAPANEEDWSTEFLAPVLSVKIVDNTPAAISHIQTYGSGHSESIVTANDAVAEEFLKNIDAAAVYHNASTRFTDGFQYGFGAEIGISTQKLHARGPMGLVELTSYKYVVRGSGQTRS